MALIRLVCCALLCACAPNAGYGQTGAEKAYLRARRDAERAFTARAGESSPALLSDHAAALTDLEGRLRPIIGRVSVRGFPLAGKITLESLFEQDEGFGIVDGLKFESADHRSLMTVTTRALMTARLGERPVGENMTPNVEEKLRSPDVYDAIIYDSRAVYRYADLAIPDASPQGLVAAMLVLRAQDDRESPPDKVLVSVVRGDRIFIIQSEVDIHAVPACNASVDARWKAARDSGEAAVFRVNSDSVYAAYRACYGEHLASIPGIGRIIRQVSALVAALPPR